MVVDYKEAYNWAGLAVTTRAAGATYHRARLAVLLHTANLVEAQMAATAFQEPLHAAGA